MDIASLAPACVWRHFATLCQIPRRSKAESRLRDTLCEWASAQKLHWELDSAGNLIVRKPASRGAEHAPGVVLQAHLDMVCQKNAHSTHDFDADPIRPVLSDGWLVAPDTTLGADNGIGVALALAALEDGNLCHGPLEALFTVDEEAGMGGAQGLEPGRLQGRLMLNLDTEEWGELYVGCAGGQDVIAQRACTPAPCPSGMIGVRLAVTGLSGGHSGVDIHKEKGHAIKAAVRILADLQNQMPLRLGSLQGGTARNAIPRECFATLLVPADRWSDLQHRMARWQDTLRRELRGVDEELLISLEAAQLDGVLPESEQAIWLASLQAAPQGVWRRSLAVAGVVETSDNLGVVQIGADGGSATFMVRSMLESGSEALADEIVALFSLSGTTAIKQGSYPGWAPDSASPLLRLGQQVFQQEYKSAARIQVIHAGLECGIIKGKYPNLDILSFGPSIHGAHAPGERVHVASVGKCWDFLRALLREISKIEDSAANQG